jgi:hypothetical protein
MSTTLRIEDVPITFVVTLYLVHRRKQSLARITRKALRLFLGGSERAHCSISQLK